MKRTTYVDILDFWVLPRIINHSNQEKSVYYFSSTGKLTEAFVTKMLRFFGYRVTKLESFFVIGNSKVKRIEFNEKANQLFSEIVYGEVQEQISSINGISSYQSERIIGALMMRWIFTNLFELEFIESIKSQKLPYQEKDILLHSSFSSYCVKKYYVDEKSFNIETYSAPLRRKIFRRDWFWVDTCYRAPSTLNEAEKILVLVLKAMQSFYYACYDLIASKTKKTPRGSTEDYDFLAILHQHCGNREDENNELYWLKHVREKQQVRVLGCLMTDSHNSRISDYYSKLTDTLLYERNLNSRIDIKLYIQLSLKWFYRIFSDLTRNKLKLWSAIELFLLMERVSFFEALFKATSIRYVWNMSELQDRTNDALAIAIGNAGGISLGSTWSMHHFACTFIKYNRNDILFLSGSRQVDILKDSDSLVKRYVLTGYQTIRFAFQALAEDKENKLNGLSTKFRIDRKCKVVTFYDNAVYYDILGSNEVVKEFYRQLLMLAKINSDILLIIKGKHKKYIKDYIKYLGDKELSMHEDLVAEERLVFRFERGGHFCGLLADVCVGISATSPVLLSCAFGRQAVLLDQNNYFTDWPANIPNLTIIDNPAEIGDAIQKSLESTTFMSKNNGGNIDAFSDLDGDIRTASYINSLMDAMSKEKEVGSAIEFADREYTRNWGFDKVRLRNGEPVTVS